VKALARAFFRQFCEAHFQREREEKKKGEKGRGEGGLSV
jgi:hypothetical protein